MWFRTASAEAHSRPLQSRSGGAAQTVTVPWTSGPRSPGRTNMRLIFAALCSAVCGQNERHFPIRLTVHGIFYFWADSLSANLSASAATRTSVRPALFCAGRGGRPSGLSQRPHALELGAIGDFGDAVADRAYRLLAQRTQNAAGVHRRQPGEIGDLLLAHGEGELAVLQFAARFRAQHHLHQQRGDPLHPVHWPRSTRYIRLWRISPTYCPAPASSNGRPRQPVPGSPISSARAAGRSEAEAKPGRRIDGVAREITVRQPAIHL